MKRCRLAILFSALLLIGGCSQGEEPSLPDDTVVLEDPLIFEEEPSDSTGLESDPQSESDPKPVESVEQEAVTPPATALEWSFSQREPGWESFYLPKGQDPQWDLVTTDSLKELAFFASFPGGHYRGSLKTYLNSQLWNSQKYLFLGELRSQAEGKWILEESWKERGWKVTHLVHQSDDGLWVSDLLAWDQKNRIFDFRIRYPQGHQKSVSHELVQLVRHLKAKS